MKIFKIVLLMSLVVPAHLTTNAMEEIPKKNWKTRLKERNIERKMHREARALEIEQLGEDGREGCTPRKLKEAAVGIGSLLTTIAGIVITIIQIFVPR